MQSADFSIRLNVSQCASGMARTIFAGCPPDVVGHEPWWPPENDTLADALHRTRRGRTCIKSLVGRGRENPVTSPVTGLESGFLFLDWLVGKGLMEFGDSASMDRSD
eukprot:238707-Amphidinium_carterae.1